MDPKSVKPLELEDQVGVVLSSERISFSPTAFVVGSKDIGRLVRPSDKNAPIAIPVLIPITR
jgi:hypothetical protein